MFLTLARPDLRARGAFAGVVPGDTITITAWTDPHGGFCLAQGTSPSCSLGYTFGDGWKLIFFPRHFAPWALRVLNGMWVGGGLLGVGLWGGGRRHPASVGALLLAAATLALGPPLAGVEATPLTEWLGAVLGVAVGRLAWRGRNGVSFLGAPPPLPTTRSSHG